MWELIRANKRKSVSLFITMGLVLLLLGYVVGSVYYPDGGGVFGVVIALIIWGILSLVSYTSGSKILLSCKWCKRSYK